MHFKRFDNGMRLAEVILGPECALSSKSVRNLVEATTPNVVVFTARLAFIFFSVVPEEYSIPSLPNAA